MRQENVHSELRSLVRIRIDPAQRSARAVHQQHRRMLPRFRREVVVDANGFSGGVERRHGLVGCWRDFYHRDLWSRKESRLGRMPFKADAAIYIEPRRRRELVKSSLVLLVISGVRD